MTEKELKDHIKDPVGGYLFFGEEDYLKDYYIGQIRRAVLVDESVAEFNEFAFDTDSFSIAALEEAVASPPLMSEKKLVRVKLASYSALPEADKKALFEIIASLGELDDTVFVLAFAPDGFDGGTEKAPSAALKSFAKHMNTVNFPFGQEAKLVRWLGRHFAKEGLGADENALRLMINLCGRSMHRLAGEASKISARALSLGLPGVSPELVSATVSVTPEEDAFRLANAVLSGDTAAALDSLGRAKRRGENPIKLLAAVTAVICDLASIAQLASEGADKGTIAKALGIRSEYKVSLYMRAAGGISLSRLAAAVSLCAEADAKMKSSSLGYVPLERLICSVGASAGR